MVFQESKECFKGVSKSKECFKSVSRMFQGCFKGVSRLFCCFCMAVVAASRAEGGLVYLVSFS